MSSLSLSKPARPSLPSNLGANNSAKDCDSCSACCQSLGCPPFLLDLSSGTPQAVGGDDSLADHQRLLDAPAEARAAYFASHGSINCHCAWLDSNKNRCRFYEHRPDICRNFEVGGSWCSKSRAL